MPPVWQLRLPINLEFNIFDAFGRILFRPTGAAGKTPYKRKSAL